MTVKCYACQCEVRIPTLSELVVEFRITKASASLNLPAPIPKPVACIYPTGQCYCSACVLLALKDQCDA